MSIEAAASQSEAGAVSEERSKPESTFKRVAKYTLVKLVMQFFTVAVGIYLTIMIANMGGYVDNIQRGQIRENVGMALTQQQNYSSWSQDQKNDWIAREVEKLEKRLGLDKPFAIRAFGFLTDALVLDLGQAQLMTSDTGSKTVRLIILERLAPTTFLFGIANLFIFFFSIFAALSLSRQYGSFWDKIIIAMSPTSTIPPWFYGLFLILIFAAIFRVLPFGGMIGSPPPETRLGYILDVAKHMILPVTAIVASAAFSSIYSWRTFFLIYSSEDYVELAKAKGLSDRDVERRYILRPTLPSIITSFSLLLIALWTGSILTETVFNWPGLGRTYFQAIGLFDTAVIVGLTIIYAYLLVVTVFFLDFIYALVDPRVRIGSGG